MNVMGALVPPRPPPPCTNYQHKNKITYEGNFSTLVTHFVKFMFVLDTDPKF